MTWSHPTTDIEKAFLDSDADSRLRRADVTQARAERAALNHETVFMLGAAAVAALAVVAGVKTVNFNRAHSSQSPNIAQISPTPTVESPK